MTTTSHPRIREFVRAQMELRSADADAFLSGVMTTDTHEDRRNASLAAVYGHMLRILDMMEADPVGVENAPANLFAGLDGDVDAFRDVAARDDS